MIGIALKLVAMSTHIVNRREVQDIVAEIKRITIGGVNYAVETTTMPDIVTLALYSLRFLGTVAFVGATGDVTINIQNALMGEGKYIIGAIAGDSVPQLFTPKLIQYYIKGQFQIDGLVKFYEFEDIIELLMIIAKV